MYKSTRLINSRLSTLKINQFWYTDVCPCYTNTHARSHVLFFHSHVLIRQFLRCQGSRIILLTIQCITLDVCSSIIDTRDISKRKEGERKSVLRRDALEICSINNYMLITGRLKLNSLAHWPVNLKNRRTDVPEVHSGGSNDQKQIVI